MERTANGTVKAIAKGCEVRVAIVRSGLRQSQLAERLGISRAFLNLIVHGKRTATPTQAKAIADALGTTVEALFIVLDTSAEPKKAA